VSVVVRPAGEADIDGVCELLHTHMSSRIPKERWRLLLDYPWRPRDANCGYLAADGDKVVGFLGLVYADRIIDGETHRFCNICAWYLLRDYRGQGIGQEIQTRSIADPGMTYTLVTATASTDRAFRRAGFEVLDEERYRLRSEAEDSGRLELIEGADMTAPLLAPNERAILEHHRAFNLRHVLFRAAGQSCYLILQNRKQGANISYHQVLYVGYPEFLGRHGQAMADSLLDGGNALFAVDRRFVPQEPGWQHEPIPQARLYRSSRLRPGQIDNLYSEIALLDLKLP
jgi:GNAT superfamily N-acetyltransferase